MELIWYEYVGYAVPLNPDPEPVMFSAGAEKCVVPGAGVPKTENVKPSMVLTPVPLIVYKAPTTGVVAVLKVNVTTPADTE